MPRDAADFGLNSCSLIECIIAQGAAIYTTIFERYLLDARGVSPILADMNPIRISRNILATLMKTMIDSVSYYRIHLPEASSMSKWNVELNCFEAALMVKF
jgi:hypothetical protein